MVATLKTSVIQEPSSATVNLTLDASGGVAVGQNLTVAGTTTFTGGSTFTGNATAAAFIPSGSTVPTNGLYLPAANSAGIATASTERLRIGASGNVGIGTTTLNASGSTLSLAIGSSTATDYAGLEFQTAGSLRAYMNATNGAFYIVSASTNPMIFYTNSSERMRIDSSGNVGIGTSSPSATLELSKSNPAGYVYEFITNTSATGYAGIQFNIGGAAGPNGTANINYAPGTFFLIGPSTNDTTTPIVFRTNNGTERMRIDSSGRVGIATTPVANRGILQIAPTSQSWFGMSDATAGYNYGTFFQANGSTVLAYIGAGGGNAMTSGAVTDFALRADSGNLLFATNGNNERARIDSSGNFLVGTTNASDSVGVGIKLQYSSTVPEIAVVGSGSANGSNGYSLYSTGAAAYRFYVGYGGTIYATSTTITAISDQRLKENIQDIDVGLDKIMALKPRKFDWKDGKGKDKKGDRGWIAQEFEQVFPDMISTWKDEPPEGGEPYKAVNADLIPVLVKAIQEQQAQITSLKAELDALKTKVGA